MNTLAKKIQVLRKQLGLSQRAFGESLGVSRDVIGNIEYGRVEPKEVFINHLCAVFQVNKCWLLYDEGEPFQEDIQLSKDIAEAISLFSQLNSRLQQYALEQLRGLVELQNSQS